MKIQNIVLFKNSFNFNPLLPTMHNNESMAKFSILE